MVAASILICHYYCFGCFFSGAQHAKNSCHQKDRAMSTMEWSFHPIVCLMTSAGGAYLHACIDISPIAISLGSYMDKAAGRRACTGKKFTRANHEPKFWGLLYKVADLSPRHFRKQAARDDATRRMEKILVKPGFGGLIQCQIYNPAIAPFFVGHSP